MARRYLGILHLVQNVQTCRQFFEPLYAETGPSSSEDDKGSGGDDGEEGGARSLASSRLWRMRAQSCCAIHSAMNARGIT